MYPNTGYPPKNMIAISKIETLNSLYCATLNPQGFKCLARDADHCELQCQPLSEEGFPVSCPAGSSLGRKTLRYDQVTTYSPL